MYRTGSEFVFSPSDLITFMGSPFASWMDRLRAEDRAGSFEPDPTDPMMEALQNKGLVHEEAVLIGLKNQFQNVVEIDSSNRSKALDATIAAIREGVDVIFQGYLAAPPFAGYSDFLVRTNEPSILGDYSYEVWDTKLAKKLKPYFAIQLCCYAEMLEVIQGVRPKDVVVVLGTAESRRLGTEEYYAYYRSLKDLFLTFQNAFDPEAMPDPAESASWGNWSSTAGRILAERDHPLQVANITRNQIKALATAKIQTMTYLAETPLERIPRIGTAVFERLKAQAHHQIKSKGREVPSYDIVQPDPEIPNGLALLPAHSDADVFFDIEGFPLVDGGLEYLWGNTYFDAAGERQFLDLWAHDAAQEEIAFEAFIDWVYERWLENPGMHVYHYGHYEIAVLRRLMGRYGSREHEVDQLLRNEVFIDLYRIVRHGMVIGEPRYSIKNVEHLYRGKRETVVVGGSESVAYYEGWREHPDGDTWQTSKILCAIRDYNIDDCDSTQELVAWLRERQIEGGVTYAGPQERVEAPESETADEARALFERICIAVGSEEDPDLIRRYQTLGWLLEFHRREEKPSWWRYFDRKGLSEPDLFDDMDCLAGLQRTETAPFPPTAKARKNLVYEYRFDNDQPFRGTGSKFQILESDERTISRHEIDLDNGGISFASTTPLPDQMSVIPLDILLSRPIPQSIRQVVGNILDGTGKTSAIVDFLDRSRPRISGNSDGAIIKGDNPFLEEVVAVVAGLEDSCLTIQGPPGAGKTFTAKHVIIELLRDGKKVGISSNSHKAINNLLGAVADQLAEEEEAACLVKVDRNDDDPLYDRDDIIRVTDGGKMAGLTERFDCLAGTAWTFARDDIANTLDYLFVDEAGQVSIANLVGMSRSARNLVLIGDQMQLGQPIQGSHPGESGRSVLDYLLQDHATIPVDMGVFLPTTYRMHPDVCRFISGCFYDERLEADRQTEERSILVDKTDDRILAKSVGIQFVPVEHEGNTQASEEEIETVYAIAQELIGTRFQTGDDALPERPLAWDDILFVAPYNHQVNLLRARLGDQAKVGSVDKFQGQEAPVVVLSLAASSAAEAPRGVDFLFSPNRLNVAISRAQCLAIVVANPALTNTPANNLEQMRLVNTFCRMVEMGGPKGSRAPK
jgi:predicted RecB family nuclease